MPVPLLSIFVNGKKVHPEAEEVEWNLAEYLRQKEGLTGTKVACGEGGCGACTVIVSKKTGPSGGFRHDAVNACITPLWTLHDCHVLTVEGISGGNNACHVLQDTIARNNGTQCGFCSPGMVMSAYALAVDESVEGNIDDLKSALEGNLCRCTGYRPILDAFKDYKKLCNNVGDVEDICKPFSQLKMEDTRTILKDHVEKIQSIENLLISHATANPSNELVSFDGLTGKYFRPSTVEAALDLLRDNPRLKVAGGCTELYILDQTPGHCEQFLLLTGIPELQAVERHNEPGAGHVRLGAALTINQVMEILNEEIKSSPEWKTRSFRAIVKLLERYGSKQIRNIATIGGSLMTSNPGSDIQTFYSVLDCWAIRYDIETRAQCSRKTRIPFKGRSLITHLEIPYTEKDEYVWMEKATKRKHVDVSIINAAAKVKMDESKEFIELLVIGFGGMAIDRFELDFHFEKSTVKLDEGLVDYVTQGLVQKLKETYRQGSQHSLEYLEALGKNLMVKFLIDIRSSIEKTEDDCDKSTFRSSQVFPLEGSTDSEDLVGKPIVHASAYKHATGEARYCDDNPKIDDEVFLAFVLSERAHAEILDVDPSEALKLDGVLGYVSYGDAPKNSYGMVIEDEEIFASSKVTSHGQTIGGIVAKNRDIARKAAQLVKVEYRDLQPRIITVEDAISHSSFYENRGMTLQRLVPDFQFEKCDHFLEGSMNVGSQAHFYLEPQGCIVIPKGEDNELEVISSTQNPMDVQRKVAEALEIPYNRVTVKVKRIGGGFGGKESRCMLAALPAAIAAWKFGKPVRCILDRDTDMRISGKRHAFVTNYKIGFTKEGRLQGLQMKIFANGGNTLDFSEAAIERVIVNMDNAYNICHFDIEGIICKTNTASNTVFRGTGGPQAVLLIENIVDRIANYLKLDPVEVRRANMYVDGDKTPYGQMIANSTVRQCWDECLRISKYRQRREEVDAFNRKSKYVKRAITINPSHYGIAYTALFLNQGASLVHIYRDGSVLITHNGVEIGQGLHTKLLQVATRELGINASKIRISDTSTDKVPNGTPTSASVGTDLIGPAVLNACQELKNRLRPYLETHGSWEDAVSAAYFDRISLSTTGFHKTPMVGWNEQKQGDGFNYFSSGAACTEVELDVLTGVYKVLRTDIVMDVGKSLNPALDIGQIEGAFVQGTGFFTLEELQFDQEGKLLTAGPGTYKVPTFSTAPEEFNVAILPGVSNPRAIYSSKAIGEPPLLLATSVFYAIKECVRAYRTEKNKASDFKFDAPATPERILLALADKIK